MKQVRHAVLMFMLERHFAMIVNLAMLVFLARTLPPAQMGLAIVGWSIVTIVFSLREFASSDFLLTLDKMTRADISTAATILIVASAILGLAVYFAAPSIAALFHAPTLERFLIVSAIAASTEALGMPAFSMLRRELAFGRIAAIRTASLIIASTVTILAITDGRGYLSLAIGALAGGFASTILASFAYPALLDARPSLRSWRKALDFGRYKGTATVIASLHQALPQIVLGYGVNVSATAFYNRAQTLRSAPEHTAFATIFTAQFTARTRTGNDIASNCLNALAGVSALAWPALAMLAILADPIVRFGLGSPWLPLIPVLQILAFGSFFLFPVMLMPPLLVALGANRAAFTLKAISQSISATALCAASFFGLTAMALCQVAVMLFQMLLAFRTLHRHALLGWQQLLDAIMPSATITLATVTVPLMFIAARGFEFDLSGREALSLAAFSIVSWLAALFATHHPLLSQLHALVGDPSPKSWPSPTMLGLSPLLEPLANT